MPESLYLDHAATTPPCPEAVDAFLEVCREKWGNPSSLHKSGADASRALERARMLLAAAFGAEESRVVWTASGTESNHLAIQGMARAAAGRGRHILIGAAEHPSVRGAVEALTAEEFEVETVPTDGEGVVSPATLASALRVDTVLVSLQWANNELGSVNDIAALVAATRAHAPQAAFHTDAVQAVGKLPDPLDDLGADAVSVAAHKLGGVRGTAALLLRNHEANLEPLLRGGGQEGGLRAGTEHVAGAVAFAVAAQQRAERIAAEPDRYLRRRALLSELIQVAMPDCRLLAPSARPLGAILALALPGLPAEPLLHHLAAEGILASAGSACHAGGHQSSPVLSAIGLDSSLHNSVLRFSFSGNESEADITRTAAALQAAAAVF